MSNGEPLVDHSRNSSFFLDSKQSVCSICHKYIFNTNHDDCIIKILNKVNSRAKVQSPKIRNNNPVEPKNHTLLDLVLGGNQQVEFSRLLVLGGYLLERCSPIAQPKLTFGGSNDDITNPYECNQTLYFSAGTSNSSAQEFKEFKSDEHASKDVWTKQFRPRSSS
ncbi:hypothetical protein Tco_0239027 [Tanacetum coccineum]